MKERQVFSMNEDVLYQQGTLSIRVRVCIKDEAYDQLE